MTVPEISSVLTSTRCHSSRRSAAEAGGGTSSAIASPRSTRAAVGAASSRPCASPVIALASSAIPVGVRPALSTAASVPTAIASDWLAWSSGSRVSTPPRCSQSVQGRVQSWPARPCSVSSLSSSAHSCSRRTRASYRSAGRSRSGPPVNSATTATSPRSATLDRRASSRTASFTRVVPARTGRASRPPSRSAPSSSSSTVTDPRIACPDCSSRFRSTGHSRARDGADRWARSPAGRPLTRCCASVGCARPSAREWSRPSCRRCA